jgi:LacI family transcriptional regulator
VKSRIHDVAELAGVSMKTVSRVLNREPNVADKTRERVLEASRELRYTPSLAARGLATSKNYLLALLYDNVTPSYVLKVQQGATRICQEAGYHLIVHPMRGSIEITQEEAVAALERLPVDGVILTSPLSDNPAILAALAQLKIRFTTLGASTETAPQQVIGIDNRKAAEDMTAFLIKSGHQDIGFVKGHKNHLSSQLRFDGFKAAMDSHGLKLRHEWIVQGDYSYTSGEVAARHIFSKSSRPTAIFASNDDMAAGVMAIAGHMGISVPDELSIGGFDDSSIASIVWPRLSTIRQPVKEMGERAADMLIVPLRQAAKKTGDVMPCVSYSHHLVIRESTKAR